jgi:hypothetical protein
MIQIRSRLDVADNTGARMATMIGVIGKRTLTAGIGDVITANVKEAATGGTVKKGMSSVQSSFAPSTPFAVRMAPTFASIATPSSSSTRISILVAPASLAQSPVSFVKRTS